MRKEQSLYIHRATYGYRTRLSAYNKHLLCDSCCVILVSLLKPLDDLFSTDESRTESQLEKVVPLNPAEISDFPNHPFKVKQDDAMAEMVESVRKYGVLVPALVRPKEDGKLTDEVILSIMQEEKPNQKEQFKMPKDRISKYFAPETPAQKIEDTIVKALEMYRKRQRDMER